MDKNFIIKIHGMNIKCNRKYIESTFPGIYTSGTDLYDFETEGEIEYYQLAKDIFQGGKYDINSDNLDYLIELEKELKSPDLQTKINIFCYKHECDENQIDQHPSIQFLIELSNLLNKLSTSNCEDISQKIIEKIAKPNSKSKNTQKKRKKSKAKKKKNNQKKRKNENKDIDDSVALSYKLSPNTVSKLFYYAIINTLSSKFKSFDELHEHQQKIQLILQIIDQIDSKSEEEEETDNDENYLDNFIKYVTKKYFQVLDSTSSIANNKQEIFYLVYYLLENDYITLPELYNTGPMNEFELQQLNDFPLYFLNFYPQKNLNEYFKKNSNLLTDSKKKSQKKKKSTSKGSYEDKVHNYLQDHQRKITEGYPSDNDDILKILIKDDLKALKSHLISKSNKKKSSLAEENAAINAFSISNTVSQFLCVSVLHNCSLLELSAFFGSRKIFAYLNEKQMKGQIRRPKNLANYIIAGRDTKIIDIYLNSIKNQKEGEEKQKVEEPEEVVILKEESDNPSSFETDEHIVFNNDLSSRDFHYENSTTIADNDNKSDNDNDDDREAIPNKDKKVIKTIKSLMTVCIERDNLEAYQYLVGEILRYQKNKCIIDTKFLEKYIAKCVSRGYFTFVPYLLSEGANLNTLLCMFCKTNNEVGINYVLQFSYVDINETYLDETPLGYCISNENVKMSLLLLDNDKINLHEVEEPDEEDENKKAHKEKLNQPARYAFIESCRLGLSKVVSYFLQKKLFDMSVISDDMLNPLHLVCMSGDLETFQEICKFKKMSINPNSKVKSGQYKGRTPLHFACISGNIEIVKMLLDHPKININIKDDNEWVPLQYAVYHGNTEIVSLLLDKDGIDVNAKSNDGNNLLHLACMSDTKETVECILNSPSIIETIDPNAKGLNDETPLQIALENQNTDIVLLLLNYKSNPVKSGRKSKKKNTDDEQQSEVDPNILTNDEKLPLIFACKKGNNDIINLLLNCDRTDVNAKLPDGKTTLYVACELELIDVVKILLKSDDIDINATTNNGNNPLIVACEQANKEIIELLLSYKSDSANSKSKNNRRSKKTNSTLIDKNAKNKKGKNALLIACENQMTDIIEMLLQYSEIDCNVSVRKGMSPLCYACKNDWENIFNELMKHGADFNYRTREGKSVLYYACLGKNLNIIRALLSKVDSSQLGMNQPEMEEDSNNESPESETESDSEFYIQGDADDELSGEDEDEYSSEDEFIDEPNSNSPLFISCMNNNIDIFNLIIDRMSSDDINYRDIKGRTLLFIACQGGSIDIVKTLVNKYKIDPNIPDNQSKTPLHVACQERNFEIVDFFLNESPFHVDINAKWDNQTPLETACKSGSLEIVKLLLKQDGIQYNLLHEEEEEEEKNEPEENLSFYAKLAKKAKNKKPRKKKKNEVPPLLCACSPWNPEIIKYLINEIPDINVNVSAQITYETALHYACEKGDAEICDLILSRSKRSIDKLTNDDQTPVDLALENNRIHAFNVLMKYINADQLNSQDKDGETLLIKACKNQYTEIVHSLLENDEIDVNLVEKNNKSALIIVAENGDNEICNLLLENSKIDIEQSYKQKTPLYLACKNGNEGVVEMLLKKGARFDSLTKNGKSPLHVACQYGYYKIVSLLLSSPNIDVNLLTIQPPTSSFKTLYSPLHYACLTNNEHLSNSNSNNNNNDNGHLYISLTGRVVKNNNNNNSNNLVKVDNNNNDQVLISKKFCVELLVSHPQIDINLQTSQEETALQIACNNKLFDIIKVLLQHPQIDTNVKDSEGRTPLHLSCEKSKIDLIKTLLNNPKTDVNAIDHKQRTPLSIACFDKNLSIIQLLINRQDLRVSIPEQKNPIKYAIKKNDRQIFKILIHHPSFDVNQLDLKSVTPLGYAIKEQNIDFVHQLLLIPGIDINKQFFYKKKKYRYWGWRNRSSDDDEGTFATPLNIALKLNNPQIMKMLAQSPLLNVNEYIKGKTVFHSAIITRSSQLAALILSVPNVDVNLKTSIDPDSISLRTDRYDDQENDPFLHGMNALHIACIQGDENTVKELLKRDDIDINEFTNYDPSLLEDIKKNLYEQYKKKEEALIQQKKNSMKNNNNYYDPSESSIAKYEDTKLSIKFESQYKNGCNALFIACSENQPQIVSLLLNRHDIDVNAKSGDDQLTPLLHAVKKGRLDAVNILLKDERCDSTITSSNGTNILHFASESGNSDLLKLILQLTNDKLLKSTNENGDTPLHFACRSNNNAATVKLLLDYLYENDALDLNVQNNEGDSPLHIVCSNNNIQIFDTFVNKAISSDNISLNLNIQNKKGESLLHIASAFNVPNHLYKEYEYVSDDNGSSYRKLIYKDDYKKKTIFGALLNNGANVNCYDNNNKTPLHYSCKKQSYTNIEILLNWPKILIDGKDESTPLMNMIESVLNSSYKSQTRTRNSNNNYNDSESDSDYGRNTSFYTDSSTNEIIDLFIEKNANIQIITDKGISFLLYAIICRSKKYLNLCFEKLKDLEKYLNYESIYGRPFDVAIDNWEHSIMTLLLKKKKYIKFSDKHRNKLIYECIKHNEVDLVFILLNIFDVNGTYISTILNKLNFFNSHKEEKDPDLQFNVNYVDSEGNTPLHIATQNNDIFATCLLSNYDKTDLNLYNKEGKTPLHYACDESDELALSMLTVIDLDQLKEIYFHKEEKGKYYSRDEELSKYLNSQLTNVDSLNLKIDINAPTKGITRNAYFRQQRKEILSKNPSQTHFNIYYNEPRFNIDFTPLLISISNGNRKTVQKLLLYNNLDFKAISQYNDTAISLVAKNWNEKIVSLLIDLPGIDLNYVPIIEKDNEEVDDEYDDSGNKIDPNQKREEEELTNSEDEEYRREKEEQEYELRKSNQNKTLLISACENNSIEIIKKLLTLSEQGIFDINGIDSFTMMSALHHICEDDQIDLLNLFIQFEKENKNIINWNLQDREGLTPLHYAVLENHPKIVDILINNEIVSPLIDINATATGEFMDGRTAISFACEKNNVEIVHLLLDERYKEGEVDPFSFEANQTDKVVRGSLCEAQSSCDVTIKSRAAISRGMSALHFACQSSNAEVVQLLLKHGTFNINLKACGKSCLFLASLSDHPDIVELLLKQEGINVNIKTPTGMTPLMAACENGCKQIVEMLLEKPGIDIEALTVEGESAKSLAKNTIIKGLLNKYSGSNHE